MPRLNFYVILTALLVYALTAGVTLRDRLLISTLHRIEHNAYVEPSANDLFEGAMSGMTTILAEEYGDDYTMYIPPSRLTYYKGMLDNQYEGLGISINTHKDGEEKQLFVLFPFYESPAYQAGLRSGDQILQIDGTPVRDKSNAEILELWEPPGKSAIHLSVVPFGETNPKDFFVRREQIHYDSVEGDYFDSNSRVFCLEAHPHIGYIRITSFNERTAEQFGTALDRMMQSGAKSFILDLRNNGGGDVWQSVHVAQMLLAPNPERNIIVTVRSRHGRERKATIAKGSQRCALPMAVLIDGDTASSSEILAAALQDHRRAVIVGTRSFGKGIIQGIMELPFQSGMLQLTDAEYRRPSGAVIHRKANAADSDEWGIIPDKIAALSKAEQSAVMQYRSLRSNAIATQREAVLEQFRQQIVEQKNDETTASERETVALTGTVPYYDAQLDEAIRALLAAIEPSAL
jgi:carboxyl-terminal processing protease